MEQTLAHGAVLQLIDERSSALRAAVGTAQDLRVQVPTCPEWSLFDLVQHVGQSQRRWAATVATGPADAPPAEALEQGAAPAPREVEALVAWSAESAQSLLTALGEAGHDRGCWTWWDRSASPQTSGAVARHQLQHVAVHTYDAQAALAEPVALPEGVALDGVDEFLSTSCAGSYRWPYEPAAVDYLAAEGRSWRLSLTADGARLSRGTPPVGEDAGVLRASLRGTAADLVLALYGRIPVDALDVAGDRRLLDLLVTWDPDA